MRIVFVPGLGADKRVFEPVIDRLVEEFSDQNLDVDHVNWIKPEKNEKLEEYAGRLFTNITQEPDILIGLSFGAYLIENCGHLIKPKKKTLISGFLCKEELNTSLYRALRLKPKRLPRILIKNFFVKSCLQYYFGIHQKDSRRMLYQMYNDSDSGFLNWALERIKEAPESANSTSDRIHGREDRIVLPSKIKKEFYTVPGGHFAIYDHPIDCAEAIRHLLENDPEH